MVKNSVAYKYFIKNNGENFKSLLYSFLMNSDNGFKRKWRSKEGVSSSLNGDFRFANSYDGYNVDGLENKAPSCEEILDFDSLIKLLHSFYFLNEEIGKNYVMKFEILKDGIFKISNEIKYDLTRNGKYHKSGTRKHALFSTNLDYNKDYEPYFFNKGYIKNSDGTFTQITSPGGYDWNRFFNPEYVSSTTIKRLKNTIWFPKFEEDVKKLSNYICQSFDNSMYSDSGYVFGRLNSRRNESKALFIAFLMCFKEGKMKANIIIENGITEQIFDYLNRYIELNNSKNLKNSIEDMYNERDWENNPNGLNIDECISYALKQFLKEEVRQLEIPFDFDDDGRSKVDTYQKGYHRASRGEVEWLAHEVKRNNVSAIIRVAELLATKVNAVEPIFIPIPNHSGSAEYTLKIAQILADKCNGKCCDILSGDARETLHGMKKKGIDPKTINMNFRIKNGAMFDNSMFDRVIYVVDNVLDTGTTFEAAKQVIQHIFGKDADIRLLTLATTNNSGKKYNIR